MKLNLKIPIVIFDLETTGTNIQQDRIIEIAMIKLMPNGERLEKYNLVNPGMPIPPDSTAIHGITNEKVAGQPTFKELARDYAKFLEGADLSGFNIMKFDVPILVEEFLRAGVEFDYARKRIVDSQRIFHLMEKRNLSAAVEFYCQKKLEDSHTARADAQASLEVLLAQVERYENKPVTDALGQPMGIIRNDMEELGKLVASDMIDLAGRMIKDARGEAIFNFGKHKGKSVLAVLQQEPAYYDWMMQSDFSLDTKRRLTEIKLSKLKR
ncbi:MAG: 3'-5' exonuclease [Cyclobacteriaceae bacterium]|nr:3'-5' exonuclease [Cyclobacteriaceae bacterium]